MQQSEPSDTASVSALIHQVQFVQESTYDQDACDPGFYRLEAAAELEYPADLTLTATDAEQVLKTVSTDSSAFNDYSDLHDDTSKGKFYIWRTGCADICSSQQSLVAPGGLWVGEKVLKAELQHSGNTVYLEMTIDVEGSPCTKDDAVDIAQATLLLAKKDGSDCALPYTICSQRQMTCVL